MYLLPKPQKIKLLNGFLKSKTVCVKNFCTDERIEKALKKLPCSEQGVELEVHQSHKETEGYTLSIDENKIVICGDSAAGTFYGIQTLRQILDNNEIPCLFIEDNPGFEYRGFYHDVTRGKIPLLSTIKVLIDQMAYYKMNSLQFYIEHTFPFKEFGNHIEENGYLTPEEIKEIDDYCYENFIEFIPSVATFGHLYELLELEEYRELRELRDFQEDQIRWYQRMAHHTINPTEERSIEIIKSMIDQILPLFRTNKFNICCDETFDLKIGVHKDQDTGRLYIDFVKKIIAHLQSKGKQVMMWADIVLQHPETIEELPADVEFLNWSYVPNPGEAPLETLCNMNRSQIVCPCLNAMCKLVEGIRTGSRNILNLLELGYKYHAKGMLNTNWGDYGNPCSLDLSMHGLVLSASKAWNRETDKDSYFDESINYLLYKNKNCVKYLTMLDEINREVGWTMLAYCYSNCIYEKQFEVLYPSLETVMKAQEYCGIVLNELQDEVWERDEYRQELLIAAEGLMVVAELLAKFKGYEIVRHSNTLHWLELYKTKWLEKNKISELFRIEHMFLTLEKRFPS